MRPEAETIPALLARRRQADGDLQAVVTADGAVTYRELDDASAAVAARLAGAGVVKGDRVALLAPNGIEWATVALAVLRMGAVLVPLSTLLRPAELLAQLTLASVTHVVTVPEFRNRHYLDELEEVAPGLVGAVQCRCTSSCRAVVAPAVDDRRAARRPRSGGAWWPRWRTGSGRPTTWSSSSPRAAGERPRGSSTPTGPPLRAVASGLEARCVGPGERLYIPMPFFWTGGFGQGLLTVLVAGATLLTEAEPEPAEDARAPGHGSGRPCSGAGRTRRRAWPPHRASPRPTCRRCATAAWRRCSHRSGARRPGRGPPSSA